MDRRTSSSVLFFRFRAKFVPQTGQGVAVVGIWAATTEIVEHFKKSRLPRTCQKSRSFFQLDHYTLR